jgi:TolB-like protein
VYIKDGKEYGKVRGAFRHRWWNYYERGLSYSEGEFYKEALEDFKGAIKQREKDQRTARTYGMHFVDYFPHRESGIIYYQLGNMEEAERELELSLNHFPSAKARFYLDRVRKSLLQSRAQEWAPPRLTLNFKTDELWTKEDPVVVSGAAEDEGYIAAVSIGGVPLFLEGSEKSVSFKESLSLGQGKHTLKVEAKNLLGMTTTRQLIINVDREGPMITVEEIIPDQENSKGSVKVSGSVYDESGVSELSINGKPIAIGKGVEVIFSEKLAIDAGSIDFTVCDNLGNQTSDRIPLSPVTAFQRPILLASSDSDFARILLASIFGPKDTASPDIKLKGWTDNQTVFLEKIYIEGQVSDQSKIESLTINNTNILRNKGRRVIFGHLYELQEGENIITVEAGDEAGNVARKTITVNRRLPKALQLAERLSLTVLPFEQKGTISDAGLSFQDNLIDALVNRNRFQMIERNKLDLILNEQKLSRTELIDKSTALRLGKLVAAESIVTGSIIETRTGIEIVGRMIDTETSEILDTEDVYDESKNLQAQRDLAEGMAIKFHREFPLIGGVVIQQKGGYIFTDLGGDKVKPQRRLLVYREEPIKHPVTGKVLGTDNEIIGCAKVTQVLEEMSKAELVKGDPGDVKRLYKVITE